MASELEGVADLTRKLQQLGALEKGKPLRDAVRAGMKPAFQKAKATAPEGTVEHKTYKGRLVAPGFLRRSLKVLVRLTRNGAFALLGVKREAFYGTAFVELGTSKMSKRPWLVPSFEATKSQALSAITATLRKAVEKASR